MPQPEFYFVRLLFCVGLIAVIFKTDLLGLDDRPWPVDIQAICDGSAPMICPLPQSVKWENEILTLTSGLCLKRDLPDHPKLNQATDRWIARHQQNFTISLKFRKAAPELILTLDEMHLPKALRTRAPVETQKTEAYILMITPEKIVLKGGGVPGIFYGLQTLSQLIVRDAGQWQIRCATIFDWPHQAFRGLHVMLPGRADLPFYHDLIDYIAELKYNHLVVEVAGGMAYQRHPEINQAWEDFVKMVYNFPGGGDAVQESQGRPKNAIHHVLGGGSFLAQDEVRELVQYAKARFINILPEIPSLSHAGYLLQPHPELAENQEDPYPDTYCPSNPATYELLFDVIDEVLAVFEPEWVHIGHDEAYTFNLCERCKDKSAPELFAGDVIKIHDYLTARGIKVMMWAEKFLTIPGPLGVRYGGIEKQWPNRVKGGDWFMPEIYPAIEKIPRDILMVDWYHSLGPYTQHFFNDYGFRVVYGNFNLNMPHWEYRSRVGNVIGGFVSNWTVTKEYGFARDTNFYSHIFSSNLLWWAGYQNNRGDSIQRLLQRAIRHFRRHFAHGLYPSMQSQTTEFHSINLADYGNLPANGDLPEIAKIYDFTALPRTSQKFHGVLVNLPDFKAENCQTVSIGPATVPKIENIKLNCKVASLNFINTLVANGNYNFPGLEKFISPEQELLAEYLVNYADGTTQQIPLRYGVNLFDWIGPCLVGHYYVDLVWQAEFAHHLRAHYDRRSQRENLFLFEWMNPFPEKPIASLDFIYKDPQRKSQVFLLGLTGIELEQWQPDQVTVLQRNQFLIDGVENPAILQANR